MWIDRHFGNTERSQVARRGKYTSPHVRIYVYMDDSSAVEAISAPVGRKIIFSMVLYNFCQKGCIFLILFSKKPISLCQISYISWFILNLMKNCYYQYWNILTGHITEVFSIYRKKLNTFIFLISTIKYQEFVNSQCFCVFEHVEFAL